MHLVSGYSQTYDAAQVLYPATYLYVANVAGTDIACIMPEVLGTAYARLELTSDTEHSTQATEWISHQEP